jgi:hypothetical protein
MYKSIIFSFIITIFLTACGGGGGSSSAWNNNNDGGDSSKFTHTGTAVDPYIEDATFFYDKNENGIHDDGEPLSSKSNTQGKFTFSTSEAIPAGSRIVMKDKGIHNGVAYTGQLSANISDTGVVSPLTTLEVEYPNKNIVELLKEANITILSTDIHKDPMDENNKNLNLTTATLAVDAFLKIKEVDDSNTTLKSIVEVTKELLDNNITNDNISETVKITHQLVKKTKQDNNLSELAFMEKNPVYRENIKKTFSKMTPKQANGIGELSSDGLFVTSFKNNILNNKSFSFTTQPKQGESTTLSINLTQDITDTEITWSVFKQPSNSNLQLTQASDKKSVEFTPLVVGEYIIKITATNNDGVTFKSTSFKIVKDLTFSMSEVSSINSSSDNDEKIGIVQNQSWVSSKSLNETELTNIINKTKYSTLTKKGYNTSKGLLIEYTPNNTTKEAIEKLKLETGIDKVYNRVYAGDKAYKSYAIYPDDNGAFDDGGSNWHLEVTNMPEAWEYTQGSDKFLLGVSDGGYDTLHDDLQGRFAAILTNAKHSHGMGVTGSMAAIKNNNKGISGINDVSQVVASYMGGSYVEQVVSTKKDSKEVKVVNNSWGYHLPSTFNPTSATIAQNRFENMQNIYAQVRQLVSYYDDKIFVWAAGNGVGNGYSQSGYYGVDAKYENGSIHYKNNMLDKLDNLLVVAAFKQDKKLIYYSSYGQSVDIAAPTHYDSLSLNNGTYTSFGGTSAAAPVVTAIASLVYSINPNLSAKEVKEILINSATEYITQREKTPGGQDEYLEHPIPIVNALEAVKMAQETISQNVTVQEKLTDIINPTLELTYQPSNINYTITKIDADISSSSTQSNYGFHSPASSNSNTLTFPLDKTKNYHEINATVHLKHLTTDETITQNHIYFYNYTTLTIETINNITLKTIPNVNIAIHKLESDMDITHATTNSSGMLKVYIDSGEYRLLGSANSYLDTVKDIYIQDIYSVTTTLPLSPESDQSQGSISGFVFDANGIALEGALVKISGGALTNGYFASALTDENGYYKLTNLGKKASQEFSNAEIESFTILVTKSGYIKNLREDVIVLDGIERVENFNLIEENVIEENEYIYKNNFEGDVSDWTKSGFWHQQDFNQTITNVNVAKGNIELAPDDNSSGTLPKAKEGTKAFWYGQESTGNYI